MSAGTRRPGRCKVTVVKQISTRPWGQEKCGKPVVNHGLCTKHLAERVRLGGTP